MADCSCLVVLIRILLLFVIIHKLHFISQAHLIAQSIGQAFQVAYMEFLKANGIDDPNLHMKDTSYEDILEQQEIMNDELETFTRKDKQKDVS